MPSRNPKPHHPRVRELIDSLGLVPHPERGHYVETYRAGLAVASGRHPGERSASTAIYFLISDDEPTTYLHRLVSDEVFHLYEGGPLDVLMLAPDGSSRVERLGLDLSRGERPQLVIEAGTWFGTELSAGAPLCLIGCTVAPGFEFADFELGDAAELASRYPTERERIARMSRA